MGKGIADLDNKISVVVPIFNAEKSLNRCIDSIIGQTHRNLEIILVNDGSTDDSLSICRFYEGQDERILVIDTPNGGVSNARNVGILQATGSYLGFVDSDDWIEPSMFEALIGGMQQSPDASLASIGINHAGWQQYLSKLCCKQPTCVLTYEQTLGEIISRSIGLGGYVWNKLFIKTDQLFDPTLSFCEDIEFVVRYFTSFHSHPSVVINQCAYHYDRTPYESFSSLKYGESRYVTSLKAYDLVLQHLPSDLSSLHEIVYSRQNLHSFRLLKHWTKLSKLEQQQFPEYGQRIPRIRTYFTDTFWIGLRYAKPKHKVQMVVYCISPMLLKILLHITHGISSMNPTIRVVSIERESMDR